MAAEQTRECMKYPNCFETGWAAEALYGNKPRAHEIYKFNIAMALGTWFFAYQLDPGNREMVQYVFIFGGLYDVHHNRKEHLQPDWEYLAIPLGVGLGVHWVFF